MIKALDNSILVTDLDGNQQSIINLDEVVPTPANLVDTFDPRLADPRLPLEGSVTDRSVNSIAGIVQSKLNLNGDIPPSWLGTDSTHAAQGDLVEYVANKGQPNGYAALDGTGKVPVAQLPSDAGVGTVTSVDLVMPSDFTVTGNPIIHSGTITVDWAAVPDGTWFGNPTGVSAPPVFTTDPISASMVPPLPADKIVTGTIDPARMPPAVGIGAGHAPGAAPDPGPTGDPTDYLARDMTYKPVPSIGPSYQPIAAAPILVPLNTGSDVTVSIQPQLIGSSLFYKITGMTDFAEVPTSLTVHVMSGQTLDAYAAKAGYTNSGINFYVNP